jgi:hypothetical protein
MYGPPDGDPCAFEVAAAFYGSATFDPADHPGVVTTERDDGRVRWAGYVTASDEHVLWVSTPDRDLTVRILASARTEGQPVVAADRWGVDEERDVAWQYPLGWGVPGGDRSGYGVVIADRPGGERVVQSLPERIDARHVEMYGDTGSFRVTVTAPTRAVAELVLASVGRIGVNRSPGEAR